MKNEKRDNRIIRHPGMRYPDETAEEAELRRTVMRRASGLMKCQFCGYEYYDHPADDALEWLNVLCDGTRVKL